MAGHKIDGRRNAGRAENVCRRDIARNWIVKAPKVVADSELCLGKSLLISILRPTVASESRMLWDSPRRQRTELPECNKNQNVTLSDVPSWVPNAYS
jgi:hypothetical protein